MSNRVVKLITTWENNEIFVFCSNEAGRCGKGALCWGGKKRS